jgi:peptidoglycan/LPS O-acetylase OafA/YrhL
MGDLEIGADSVIPALVVLGVIFVLAHATAKRSTFYREALTALETGRCGELDGLRGFLAPAVFISHIASSYYWCRTGVWGWPPSTIYALCGSVPVSLFFMITGFLFWRRAVAAQGRIDIIPFLRARLRRLAPLYLACLAFILAIVGVETKAVLAVPATALVGSLAQWACFGVFGLPDINGLPHTHLIDPALWTLAYEWLFYLALPGLALLATPARLTGLTVLIVILLLSGRLAPVEYVILNFLVGMITAQVATASALPSLLRSRTGAAIGLITPVVIGFTSDGGYDPLLSLALAPLFAVVVAGNNLFGILSLPAARCLGVVSYSIYLLHGIVLRSSLDLASHVVAIDRAPPILYWLMMLPVTVGVVGLSFASYRWIEHPFLAPGSRWRLAGAPIKHA